MREGLPALSEAELRSLLWREERGKRRPACIRAIRARLRRMVSTREIAEEAGLRPGKSIWPQQLRHNLRARERRRALRKRYLMYATPAQQQALRDRQTAARQLRRRCQQVNLRLTQRRGHYFISKLKLRATRDAEVHGSIFDCNRWLDQTYSIVKRERKNDNATANT
jgi:hypothetical protein